MSMTYISENGYQGIAYRDIMFKRVFYNISIIKDDKVVYHATLDKMPTAKELMQQVEDFPEFLEMITRERRS